MVVKEKYHVLQLIIKHILTDIYTDLTYFLLLYITTIYTHFIIIQGAEKVLNG